MITDFYLEYLKENIRGISDNDTQVVQKDLKEDCLITA